MIDIGFGIDIGVLLLVIALIAFLFDAFLLIAGKYIEKWELYSEMSLSTGMIAIIISFLYFSYSILTLDYTFFYVSEYTSNDMDFFLRLSVIWSSQPGSYFFWAVLIAILYLIFRSLFRNYAHESIFWRSFVLAASQVAIIVFLTLLSEPFKINATPPSDGLGLNPLLMNIWNVIHPPIIFISYALCFLPMVIAITRISILEDGKVPDFEGKEKLDNFFEFTVSLAWLALSTGIIIGGYWAYITLGWGGFWAWDPVETGSLIPWLFMTLYFHGKSFFGKREYLSNYIVSMSYIGALFVTYLTRSGVISSVHAFVPHGALERFLILFIPENSFLMSIILRFIPEERILFLFIAIIVTFLLPHFHGIKSKEITKIPLSLNKNDFQASKSQRTALKISFIVLLAGTYWMIFGLIFPPIYDVIGYIITFHPKGFSQGITIPVLDITIPPNFPTDQLFYNNSLLIFGAVLLFAQFFCTFYPRLSVKKKFTLLISGLIAGVTFSLSGFFYRNPNLIENPIDFTENPLMAIFNIFWTVLYEMLGEENPIFTFLDNFWTNSDKANFVLPLLFLGVIGLIAEFINITLKENKNLLRKTSQTMLHLSFLVILIGALMSTNMTITKDIDVIIGDQEIPGTSLTITIIKLEKKFPDSGLHRLEFNTQFMLSTKTRIIGYGISSLHFDKVNRQGHEVTIISDLFSDIYIVTIGVYENALGSFQAAALQIKIIPYINILWMGCLLLHFAMIPLTIGRFILLKKSYSPDKKVMDKNNTKIDLSENENTSDGGMKSG
ncbi:MAG: cytochrome c biogenesis protein CcsA [Candidatus Hermodarchaeota archaeon]